jgi:hypothetical protein
MSTRVLLQPPPEVMSAIEADFNARKSKKYIIEQHGVSLHIIKRLFPQHFSKVYKNRGKPRSWDTR